jgi:hypothetical protein
VVFWSRTARELQGVFFWGRRYLARSFFADLFWMPLLIDWKRDSGYNFNPPLVDARRFSAAEELDHLPGGLRGKGLSAMCDLGNGNSACPLSGHDGP